VAIISPGQRHSSEPPDSTRPGSTARRRAAHVLDPLVRLSAEVPATLHDPAPRALGALDQAGLWGNLGVSLLGFTGAMVVLQPGGTGTPTLPLVGAVLAVVVGTVLGSIALGLSAVPGAETGSPAMVLLRGVFGTRVSYLPTALNIVQMLGWGTFELVTIATAARMVVPGVPQWGYVVSGGAVTTLLAIRPLGTARLLRRYVTVAVVLALAYLALQLLRRPLPAATVGSWSGFWPAADSALAVAISWVPMASDYARHSRSRGAALAGTAVGYGLTQIACYLVGILAIVTVAHDADHVFGAFLAVPAGTLVFAVLAVRELDQSFANVYSTTVSTQNLRPRWDRRVLAAVIGSAVTVLALVVHIGDYASFLSLIGSLFVPLFGVVFADWYLLSGRHRWDLSEHSPARPLLLLPWVLGFLAYQMIYPGGVSAWARLWGRVDDAVGFVAQPWMSASVVSFVVAVLVTLAVGRVSRAAAGPQASAGLQR